MPLPHPSFLALNKIIDETFWWLLGTVLAMAFAIIAIHFPFLPIWLGWSTYAPLATCLSYLIWYLGKLSWDQFKILGRLTVNHSAVPVEGVLTTAERRSAGVWTLYLIAMLITLSSIGMLLIAAPGMLSVLGAMLATQIGVTSVVQTGLIVASALLAMQTVAFMIYRTVLRWSVDLNPKNPAQVGDRNLYYGSMMALYYIVMIVPISFIMLLVGLNQTFTWAVHQLVAWMHCSFPAAMAIVGAALLVALPATCGIVLACVTQCRSWYRAWVGRNDFRKRVAAALDEASTFLGITSGSTPDASVESYGHGVSGAVEAVQQGRVLSEPPAATLPAALPATKLSASRELGVIYAHSERHTEITFPVFVVMVQGVQRLFVPAFRNASDPYLSLYGSGDHVVTSADSVRGLLKGLQQYLLRNHLSGSGRQANDWGYYFNVTTVCVDGPMMKVCEKSGYVLADLSIPMDKVRGEKVDATYTKANLYGHVYRYVMDRAERAFANIQQMNQHTLSSQGAQWVTVLRLMILVEGCNDVLHIASLPMLLAIDKALQAIAREAVPPVPQPASQHVTMAGEHIKIQLSDAKSIHYNIAGLHARRAKASMEAALPNSTVPAMVSQFYVASVYHLWMTVQNAIQVEPAKDSKAMDRNTFLDTSIQLDGVMLKHFLDQQGPGVGLWFLLIVSHRLLAQREDRDVNPTLIQGWLAAEARHDDPGMHRLRCYDAPDPDSPCAMALLFDYANRLESPGNALPPPTHPATPMVSSLGVMAQAPGERSPSKEPSTIYQHFVRLIS